MGREGATSRGRRPIGQALRDDAKTYTLYRPTLSIVTKLERTEKGTQRGAGIGLALGVGFGIAIDNIGLGMAIGLVLGAAVGRTWDRQTS